MTRRVVCIGDSITYGEHVERDRIWTALVGRDPEWRVVNKGVCGDTTRLGLERFPSDVQQQEADFVLIQFGANDCNRWETDRGLPRVSEPAFRANLEEMVLRCRTFGARPILVTSPPSNRPGLYDSWNAHYAEVVRQVAHWRSRPIAVLDARAAFAALDGYLLPDGLHLNEQGHEDMANLVLSKLGDVS